MKICENESIYRGPTQFFEGLRVSENAGLTSMDTTNNGDSDDQQVDLGVLNFQTNADVR
jgi:hypothetical protein